MRKIQPSIRAFLQVTCVIPAARREDMITRVFLPGRQRFLERVTGAVSMDLLVREEDIQILHGLDTMENTLGYQNSAIFKEIIGQFADASEKAPDIALYNVD